MSNNVNNMIICPKIEFFRLFYDCEPYSTTEHVPNISFNKLFGVGSVDEYYNTIGIPISYGWGFSYISRHDNKCVIKFQTKSFYPIEAIIKAIKLSHDIEWFVVEENCSYVSKFYWDEKVREAVLYIEKAYSDWYERHLDFEDALFDENESDCGVWYFLKYYKGEWKQWPSDDNFIRYKNNYAHNVKYPFNEAI